MYILLVIALLGLVALCVVESRVYGAKSRGQRLERILNSPNYNKKLNGGRFVNEIETVAYPYNLYLSILKYLFDRTPRRRPKEFLTMLRPSAHDFSNPPETGLRVTWLGHATVLLELGGQKILIDPMFSKRSSCHQFFGPSRFHKPPIDIKDLPNIDIVLLSHDHNDHLDYGSIKQLIPKTKFFISPLGVGAHLERWGVDAKKIKEFDWWDSLRLGPLELTCTPARHFSGRGLFHGNKTLWSSWVIRDRKNSIYYSGDTGYMADAFKKIGKKYGPFNLTIMQIGAYNSEIWPHIHMTPEEALLVHKEIKGKLLLPVHWGTFNLGMHPWDEPLLRLEEASRQEKVSCLLYPLGRSIMIDGIKVQS